MLEKLNALNGQAPNDHAPNGQAAAAQVHSAQQLAPEPGGPLPVPGIAPKPPCTEVLDLYAWERPGAFTDVLSSLRAAVARSGDAVPATAALVEFYLVNGLANEAISAAAAHPGAAGQKNRERLTRDADIARLARGEAIASDSPLLADSTECARRDLGLWRALQAAATGDPQSVAANAHEARLALDAVPSPLREIFALIIANAADDRPTLESMAAALRNRTDGGTQERAVRLLIRARLAADSGAEAGERELLGKAATAGRGVVALQARLRLAALDANRDGEVGAHARAVLRDLARTYRLSRLGEDAAVALARSKLARGDYAAALAIADESSANHVAGESRGARMAAQILRDLLANPARPGLPDVATRIALFWRYEGYATPGERGDDIRLGAIQLMLSEHFPEAALDVARQISATASARPKAAALIAMAEGTADDGDPNKALAIARGAGLPGRPAAAEALARLGRPGEAAHQLDGLPGLSDRLRRAALLFAAHDWPAAASAYAAALREAALNPEEQAMASSRFGIAAALDTGQAIDLPPRSAVSPEPMARRLFALAAMPAAAPAGADPVAALRIALARTGQIETMLNR